MINLIRRYALYLAWLISLISTFGSLYVSEILNIAPCSFCWYQRIFVFPLVIILAIAAYKKDSKIVSYIIALPLIGACFALFQNIFTYVNPLVLCEDCADKNIKLFHFLDLSLASFISFISIFSLLLLSKKKQNTKLKKKR